MGVYDNGYKVLGTIYNIKEYICKMCENYEDIEELIEDLENYDNDTIVVIDYDNGMGYRIDYFTKNDKIGGI